MSSKTVLITGSSAGGIGHALALAFQKHGATVFATARSISKMQDLASLPNVHLLALDVTSPASIAAAAKEVEAKTGGKLDVLINNAGVQYVMPALDVDIEKARDVFEANYWGPLRMIQAFKQMLVKAKGTIVNVGSAAGIFYVPFQSQYNASKAAINQYSETLRMELAPLNVKVVTLVAGNVSSNMVNNAPPPTQLPEHSFYKPIEKEIAKEEAFTNMSTSKFAEEVASEVLNGASGRVFKGANSGVVKWLIPFLPQWIFDKLVVANGRGLGKMPKLS
ncbi:NADPH-dependent 1-acyl dihydroxyacetone phosphate reductase [Didymosphaeria variabile]|uniref:NADPH-dependent 1-acyl dihydroxyacetone phosphate reductase n=1 Tax=Didymosphaeria variabile TaxID=1932322 RepID=A0A9W8XM29_9PLEO|nr:NADPH-dependent 1-acyl dihydroxyacetone phosphate reductase [Didymosphaeria variabile]KAJ4354049.1 NADPH-dependent 1-acyl dihydroxyacetone phosphate reductase [Didymosphaeria variabile]